MQIPAPADRYTGGPGDCAHGIHIFSRHRFFEPDEVVAFERFYQT
ncbi:uncharacterized protein METZ01_LOCUS162557 [marine metagenome]|uniref:Uncharacterized protein n=1 Tax=marine metagenome TaxID=408172 RepID=A0A382B8Y0_9ZZZZ